MAPVENARHWQRYAYPADVVFTTGLETATAAHSCPAWSVDLSLGGMQLSASAAPELGSPVSCKFLGGPSPLQLRGYVRWTQPEQASLEDTGPSDTMRARVGLEFEPLSAVARQVLQALICHAQRPGELVRVHLPNWAHPLQGVAVASEHGVRLHVPLPCFVTGSTIKFESLAGERELEGRVLGSELTVSAQTQALELALQLEPCEPTRKRRYMVYDSAEQIAAESAHAESAWVPAVPQVSKPALMDHEVEDEATEVFTFPRRTRTLWLASALLLMVGIACVAVTLKRDSARQHAAAPAAPAPVETAIAAVQHAAVSNAALTTTIDEHGKRAPRSEPVHELQPQVAQYGDTTELFIPIKGSLDGMRTALWADPAAVVLDLPAGHVVLPHDRYNIRSGAISGVSVGSPHGVTQLRVYLSALLTRYSTTASAGGVTLYLKREVQSRPPP